MSDSVHVSKRPLTLDEWQQRLNTARDRLVALDHEVGILVGALAGTDDPRVVDAIHSSAGKLGSLKGQVQLAQRRIDRGLV